MKRTLIIVTIILCSLFLLRVNSAKAANACGILSLGSGCNNIWVLTPTGLGIFGNYGLAENGDDGDFSGGLKIELNYRPKNYYSHNYSSNKKDLFRGFDFTYSRVNFTDKSTSDDYYVDCYNINYNHEIEGFRIIEELATVAYIGPGYYKLEDGNKGSAVRVGLGFVLRPSKSNKSYFDLSGNYHINLSDGSEGFVKIDDFFEMRCGFTFTFFEG
ncbi:hypothetical protein ACFL2A_02075 [Thermodesulfobacteriota bacterium]